MKALFGAVAASVLVAVAILLLSWTTYFAELNSTAYDFTMRLAGRFPFIVRHSSLLSMRTACGAKAVGHGPGISSRG